MSKTDNLPSTDVDFDGGKASNNQLASSPFASIKTRSRTRPGKHCSRLKRSSSEGHSSRTTPSNYDTYIELDQPVAWHFGSTGSSSSTGVVSPPTLGITDSSPSEPKVSAADYAAHAGYTDEAEDSRIESYNQPGSIEALSDPLLNEDIEAWLRKWYPDAPDKWVYRKVREISMLKLSQICRTIIDFASPSPS